MNLTHSANTWIKNEDVVKWMKNGLHNRHFNVYARIHFLSNFCDHWGFHCNFVPNEIEGKLYQTGVCIFVSIMGYGGYTLDVENSALIQPALTRHSHIWYLLTSLLLQRLDTFLFNYHICFILDVIWFPHFSLHTRNEEIILGEYGNNRSCKYHQPSQCVHTLIHTVADKYFGSPASRTSQFQSRASDHWRMVFQSTTCDQLVTVCSPERYVAIKIQLTILLRLSMNFLTISKLFSSPGSMPWLSWRTNRSLSPDIILVFMSDMPASDSDTFYMIDVIRQKFRNAEVWWVC